MRTAAATSFPPFEESCPWCGQSIPHEKLDEIRERIQTNERAQTRAIERRLEDEFKTKLEEATTQHAASIAEMNKAKAAAIKQAEANAAKSIAAAEAEFERRRAEEVQLAADAKKAAEANLAEVEAQREQQLRARLDEQREALAQHHLKELNGEKARAFADRQKLEQELAKMQRQLQQKSANELGEGAEIDLFERLKAEFPGDEIVRIKHGEPGADIQHTVREAGRVCSVIVYDSKNRVAWRNTYVTKLHSDQIAAKADVSILASSVFPAGVRQLHAQDGVVIANPARVIALVSILRRQLIHIATLRLSDQARVEKMDALYDYITSERCSQLFSQAETLTQDLLDLDVKEKRTHDTTWEKRGRLINSVVQTQATLQAEIDRIVTTPVVPVRRAT
jgi:hypothetical protein